MEYFNEQVTFPGRQHRLDECEALHMPALLSCQQLLHQSTSSSSSSSSSSWFGLKTKPLSSKSNTNTGVSNSSSCSAETHALIQCRALAVGCTRQVTKLKNAIRDKKGDCEIEQKEVGTCLMQKREEMRGWYMNNYKKGEKGGE